MFETTDSGSHKDSISRGNKSHFVVRGIWEHKHFSFSIQRFAYRTMQRQSIYSRLVKNTANYLLFMLLPPFLKMYMFHACSHNFGRYTNS